MKLNTVKGQVRFSIDGMATMEELPKEILIQTIFDLRKKLTSRKAYIRLLEDKIVSLHLVIKGKKRSKNPKVANKRASKLQYLKEQQLNPTPKGRYK
jgi:hypothetical protein